MKIPPINSLLIVLFVLFSVAASAQNIKLKIQRGHSDKVNDFCFTPDGKMLISCSDDKTIKVWDVESGKELRTLAGHSDGVKSVDVAVDGTTLISGGNNKDKTVITWNLRTGGRLSENRSFKGELAKLIFYDYSRKVVVLEKLSSFEAHISIWNKDVTEKVADLKIPKNFYVKDISVNTTNQEIVAVGKYLNKERDKCILVFNGDTGAKVQELRGTASNIVGVSHSLIGNTMVTSGNKIQVWSRSGAKYELKETLDINATNAVYFSVQYLLFTKANDLYKYNLHTKKVEDKILNAHNKTINALAVTKSKKYLVTAANDNKVKFWDRNSFSEIPHFASIEPDLAEQVALNNKVLYVVTNQKSVLSWNLEKAQLKKIETNLQRKRSKPAHVASAANGKYLLFTGTENKGVEVWNVEKKVTELFLGYTSFVSKAVWIPNTSLVAGIGRDRRVIVWNMKLPNVAPVKLAGHRASITALAVSADGRYLYTGDVGKKVLVWDMASLTNVGNTNVRFQVNSIATSPNGNEIAIACGSTRDVSALESPTALFMYTHNALLGQSGAKAPLKLVGHKASVLDVQFSENGAELVSAGADNLMLAWDVASGVVQKKHKVHSSDVNSVTYLKDTNVLVSGSSDASVKLTDAATGKVGLNMVTFENGREYIVYNDQNYYSSTKNGASNVHFVVDNKVFLFEQFDLKLNRPDLVYANLPNVNPALLKAYKQAYLKRLRKMKFTETMLSGDYQIPSIELLNDEEIAYQSKTRNITLHIKAADQQNKLDRINVWVNDVPVFGSAGIDLRQQQTQAIEQEVSFELSSGKNKIQVSVLNQKGAESYKLNKFVHYQAGAQKPDLYVIGIGVSKFKTSEFNLDYAAKDAQDVVRKFTTNASKYANVHSKLILNEQATRENILAVKNFLKNSKTDDKVVLFIASHGLLNEYLDYYLATSNIDFYHPNKGGLLYDDLEGILDGIPARNKLLLIDACHSGEVDQEEAGRKQVASTATTSTPDGVKARGFKRLGKTTVGLEGTYELMKNLFADIKKGSGATVISAAGGKEFALENANWNNGVFTCSLLDGLSNLKADSNKNGKVDIRELRDYVGKRVQELTNGQQNPTFRKENLENNYEIW